MAEELAAIREKDKARERTEWLDHAQNVLIQYSRLLSKWKDQFAPRPEDIDFHPLFVEACQQEAKVEYLLDLAYDSIEQNHFYDDYYEEMKRIERRIEEYMAASDARGCA